MAQRQRPKGWITWANLGVDGDERRALRRAGIAPGDLETLAPLDLVVATDELVDEARATALQGRSSLLRIATPAWVRSLERAGVRDRADLASRDPLELFDTWQQVSPYTNPGIVRYLATTIEDAGGPRRATLPDAAALVRRAWWRRFADGDGDGDGHDVLATRSNLRLRIEALRVDAPVVDVPDGRPPLRHDEVAVDDPAVPTTFVGHWQWAGHFAPFLRLETLAPGASIEVRAGRSATTGYEVTAVLRGAAPLDLDDRSGDVIVLVTPPHLRWPPWLRDWGLPGGDDDDVLERTWVQTAVVASPR